MKIVGVTACPTAIAHTYMSAEKLEVTARNLNHQAKFETQRCKNRKSVILTRNQRGRCNHSCSR